MNFKRSLIALIGTAALVALPAPASADHLVGVDVSDKRSSCVIGPISSPAGVWVYGTLQKAKDDSFTCQFKSFPKYVSAEESLFDREYVLPKEGFTFKVFCYDGSTARPGSGTLTVKGNGHATVTCELRND